MKAMALWAFHGIPKNSDEEAPFKNGVKKIT